MKHSLSLLPRFLFHIAALLVFLAPVHAEPANLTLLRKEVCEYHDSGRYQKDIQQVINKAKHYIKQQNTPNKPHKMALVLDIDETSLSNYSSMIKQNFVASQRVIYKHIEAANDPAIKPTLNLYNYALNHGISVFFVSGRAQSLKNATVINLQRAGYKNWSGLYLRPEKYDSKSIIPFKSQARARIMAKGYTIIANIGDQYSDIKGGYAKKGFKLPNPYYYLP